MIPFEHSYVTTPRLLSEVKLGEYFQLESQYYLRVMLAPGLVDNLMGAASKKYEARIFIAVLALQTGIVHLKEIKEKGDHVVTLLKPTNTLRLSEVS